MQPTTRPPTEQCAIVTGGTSGVGRCAALDLVRRNVGSIILTGRDPDRGRSVCEEIVAIGADAHFVAVDLNEHDAPGQLAAAVDDYGRGVDIVVNAAGLTDRASVTDATESTFDKLFTVNVRSPFFITQQLMARMVTQGHGGAVVNILSFAMYGGAPDIAVYAMTKSALGVYTKNAAFTMREAGIRVNGLNMGWTFTPGEDAIMQRSHGASSGWQADYAEMLPLGRLLDPAEVGRAVGYLATEDSAPMTGSIVDFDQVPFGVGDWPPA